jgi:hypothetical protein
VNLSGAGLCQREIAGPKGVSETYPHVMVLPAPSLRLVLRRPASQSDGVHLSTFGSHVPIPAGYAALLLEFAGTYPLRS